MAELNQLKDISTQIRRDVLRMVHECASGHPGGALGCADLLTALYFQVMDYKKDSFDPNGRQQDLFFLSIGHLSALYYAVLARAGFFDPKELATFRKINSRLQGHPTTHDNLPGVYIATGSLGQGMSVAIGAAITKKLNKDNHLVYSLHGDGEMEEGQNWEAIMFAPHQKIDNLISIVDCNGQQIDGSTEEVCGLTDLKSKFEVFGWDVLEMQGNDMEAVLKTLELAKSRTGKGKPIAIMMKTKMGYGVDFMEDNHKWHGVAPSDEQLKEALSQLQESTIGDY